MKPISIDLRKKIVDTYLKEKTSIRKVAEQFSVSFSTVWLLLQQYRKTGNVNPKPHGGGQPAKLDVVDSLVIADILRQQPDLTIAEVRDRLVELTDKPVSVSTVRLAMHRLGLTHKKKTLYAEERRNEKVQQARAEFEEAQPAVPVNKVHVVDEAGVNLGMVRDHGWAPCGQRAIGEQPFNPGPNISLIGSLKTSGMTACLMIEGPVDGEVFKAFITQMLVPKLQAGDIVFMDNVRFHQVAGVREAIEGCGAVLCYLPPYSPDYSPIELCWSKLKGHLRSVGARTMDALQEAIKSGLEKITEIDIVGWFKHCGFYIQSN